MTTAHLKGLPSEQKGILYLIPTPIGNLEDITLRGLRMLSEVDLLACEDTRTTAKLLRLLEIRAKELTSLHAHNETSKSEVILRRLQQGENVGVVSDAGSPLVSDPGATLVRLAIEQGFRVEALPGTNSMIPALMASGLKTHPFHFEGFLPTKKGRKTRLQSIAQLAATIILFESPHRIGRLVNELLEPFGPDRKLSIGREISKRHEEYIRGSVIEVQLLLNERDTFKGECVVIIEGRS